MKKLLCAVLVCLMGLSACGNSPKQFDSIDDYISEYSFTVLRDQKHPEDVLWELAMLLPIPEESLSNFELTEISPEKAAEDEVNYENNTYLFGNKAEISVSYRQQTFNSVSIRSDMHGSEYAEAYYVCEKLLDNLSGSKSAERLQIKIDGVEAPRAALEHLFEDFDTTKPFYVSWFETINGESHLFSVGYYCFVSTYYQNSYFRIYIS